MHTSQIKLLKEDNMKNFKISLLLLTLIFSLMGSGFAKGQSGFNYTAFGGFDLLGNADQDSDYETLDGDEDMNPGISLGIEGAMTLNKNILAGLGFQARLPRDIESDDIDTGYSAVIPYLLLQIDFPDSGEAAPYLIAHLGVHIFFLDTGDAEKYFESNGVIDPSFETSPGVYFGLGGGFHFTEQVGMRILYSVSTGENEVTAENAESDNMATTVTMFTVSIAYHF